MSGIELVASGHGHEALDVVLVETVHVQPCHPVQPAQVGQARRQGVGDLVGCVAEAPDHQQSLGRAGTCEIANQRQRLGTRPVQVVEHQHHRAGRSRPPLVVLVLDDLHWAGAQTLALVRYLARTGSAERLLVIGTFRDTTDEITDPLASCLADLRRLDGVARLHMDGFDEDNVERFVAMATGHELDPGMRRFGRGRGPAGTAGNPFYVGELWRHLVATGNGRALRGPMDRAQRDAYRRRTREREGGGGRTPDSAC